MELKLHDQSLRLSNGRDLAKSIAGKFPERSAEVKHLLDEGVFAGAAQ